MNNLFSIFDPCASFNISLNWLSALVILFSLPNIFWAVKGQMFTFLRMTVDFVYAEFRAITGPLLVSGGLLIPLSLFLTIALNNFFGLFPYTFTASSHLTFTVALAFPLWVGHMSLAWAKTPQLMFAHLVPLGTPYALMPFMVLIELVSSVIRPLTLSVRLAANMVAGHLLLTLLSSQFSVSPFFTIPVLLFSLVLLGTLELAVALIQAYVFSVLSVLYVSEVNSPTIAN